MSNSENAIRPFLEELIVLCNKYEMVPSNNANYSAYVKEYNPVEYWGILRRYMYDATKIKHIMTILEVEKIELELRLIYHRCPMCESKDLCADECPVTKKWQSEESE